MSSEFRIGPLKNKLFGSAAPVDTDVGATRPFQKRKAGLEPYRKPYYFALASLLLAGYWMAGGWDASQPQAASKRVGEPQRTEQVTLLSAARPAGTPQDQASPGARAGQTKFAIGDHLKVTFYERLEVEEDKWGANKPKTGKRGVSFQIRPEFSGEFTVADDGSVTIPVLGDARFAGRYSDEVQADLVRAFEALSGRQGYANLAILDRQPIYVVGPLKNPGAYKLAPGMTVLHAIALAGGLDRGQQLNWQLVDSAREADKRETVAERAKRLLARRAILLAERDKSARQVPKRLVELSGEVEAKSLMSSETSLRQLTLSGFLTRQRSLTAAVELANSEIETLTQRIGPLEASLKIRNERLKNFDHLREKGLQNTNLALQAQADVVDRQGKKEDVLAALAQANRRLSIAREELENNVLAMRTDLEKEIASIDAELPQALKSIAASESVLGVMNAAGAGTATESSLVYEILRRTSAGEPHFISADVTTPLEIGDVVYVRSEVPARRN